MALSLMENEQIAYPGSAHSFPEGGTACPERVVRSGPELDRLVAEIAFAQDEVEPYSTDVTASERVRAEIELLGYTIFFRETDVLQCDLMRNRRRVLIAWGFTYKECLARALLKIYGCDPE